MLLGLGAFAFAQPYNITFQVDMNTQSPVADSVTIAGDFQDDVVGQSWSAWTPGITVMDDGNNDGIYELTVQLPAGSYEYKYLNGTQWGTDEGVPGACSNNGNRTLTVSADATIPLHCFASCDPCPTTVDTVTVTFQVDMSNETVGDSVTVAGSWQGSAVGQGWNNWTPGISVLTDPDMDGVYTLTVDVLEGSYEYKYLNGTQWGTDEGVPSACAVNNNRELVIQGPGPIMIPVHCFASCDTCVPPLPPINVTFQVDMNSEIVNSGGIFVAGNFMNPAWVKDSLQMTDANSDGIYEFTASMVPNEYQYKFFNGPGGDPDGETADFETDGCGVPSGVGGWNRLLDITDRLTDTILPVYVYNSCNTTMVSVEDRFAYDFNLYPNPFTNRTTIELVRADQKAYDLRIVNITGQVVFERTDLRNDRIEISRNGLESGMYFIEIENEKGVKTTRKVVVQ
ncbi:MAG: T9SS type A sorting domain-containing protein [Bacteroidota bacterium]